MTSLLQQMLESYRLHPAFQFDQPRLKPDLEAVDDFDQVRLEIGTLTRRSPASQALITQECERTLGRIFAELRSQAADEMHGQFVEALGQHSARILKAELNGIQRRGQPNRHVPDVPVGSEGLDQQRFVIDQLPRSVVDELIDIFSQDLADFRQAAELGESSRESLSRNSTLSVRAATAVLDSAFERLGINHAVSKYAGFRVYVEGMAVELSVPAGAQWWRNTLPEIPRPPQTLYAHLDETIGAPKAIVYLSDVTTENGPTTCYPQVFDQLGLNRTADLIGRAIGCVGEPGSALSAHYGSRGRNMSSANFRRHFMTLPDELLFNSHLGWDVLPGSDFEASMVAVETPMLGPAGTFIAFDGARLFHRGGLLSKGERIALQVIFRPEPGNRSVRLARHAVKVSAKRLLGKQSL